MKDGTKAAILVGLALAGCGRSRAVPDKDLAGLVLAPPPADEHVDLAKAAHDPDELGRALMLPQHAIATALGPVAMAVATDTSVEEDGKQVSELTDRATLEMGADGAYHGVYDNSADYGREIIFTGGKLYLRPRYARWHERAPETEGEPQALRDAFTGAIGATWDLLAPGAVLSDGGTAEVAGRQGRRIVVALSKSPKKPPAEALSQRAWRATRTVDALSGEVVLDAQKGVPLRVKLAGQIGYTRDGQHFTMRLSVGGEVTSIAAVAITAPADDQVVATPERLREVDDRDFLLHGIAPPLKKHDQGSAGAP